MGCHFLLQQKELEPDVKENFSTVNDVRLEIHFLFFNWSMVVLGFLDSSVGKDSTCNAGDSGSIPGLGRSTGEGIGYPLQYSWASLVTQPVKNLPTTWETWVRSMGWEDPLEKGKATYSSILARRIPWTV